MKRRLLYLLAIPILFFTIGLGLIQPQTARAANPDECNALLPNCIGGSAAATAGKSVAVVCPLTLPGNPISATGALNTSGQDFKDTPFFKCEQNWANHSKNKDSPPKAQAGYSTTAPDSNFCSNYYTGEYLTRCNRGFQNGAGACQNNDSLCRGAAAAKTKADATNPNGGGNNNGESAGDTEPTCETSGNPLTWMLCPVFNLMADSSQWIFQNLVEPFLITPPISTNPNDPSFQIWSNLRIYGNIFLIIALLVIVFGESIGGGLIDAYTAKKVLPRLLVAAVLINLSIYIVAFLVDVSNVLGQGIGALLTSPLTHCNNGAGANCWDFQLTNGDTARVFGVGLIGLLAGGTAVAGFLGTVIFGGFAGVSAAITVAFFVMLPIFFSILAVFITLIIRKGLILMLVLISPIAFALYCLPNTERYFKRWWDLLIEALMVYPIVIAIFGIAEILSVTILAANGISASDLQSSDLSNFVAGNLNRTLALVVAFLLQFLPLLAVPFSFRIAGGALSRIYEAATGAGARVNQLAESRREHAKRDYQSQALSGRGRMYHAARDFGEKNKGIPGVRRASRFAAARAGGYNIEGLLSAARAEKMKQLEDQIATGRDEEIRGLTVNKKAALDSGRGVKAITDAAGNTSYQDISTGRAVDASKLGQYEYQLREDSNGRQTGRSFQSLGGAWIDEQDVDAGYDRWGRDQFAQQGALSYEMRKALTDDQRSRIETKFPQLATEGSPLDKKGAGNGWGMTKGEAYGAWIGSAFANQNSSLQYKYMNKDLTGGNHFDHAGFVNEVFEKRGSYDMSRMDATSIRRLEEAWDNPGTSSAQKDQLRAIAQTMDQRMRQARSGNLEVAPGEGDEAQLQASGLGAGHVNQAMASFVSKALPQEKR